MTKTTPPKTPRRRWWRRRDATDSSQVAVRDFSLVTLGAALLLCVVALIAYRFVRPAPPHEFVISTGAEGGAYQLFGERYRELLERDKIRVVLQPSAGSVENLRRVADPDSGVDVAFVQGGVAAADEIYGVVTLATLYLEPLWVFYRGDRELTRLSELAGKQIAVGPEGSGTRTLAQRVLNASDAMKNGTRLSPVGGRQGAETLAAGRVDALMLVAAPDAPVIQKLLTTPGIRLMSLSQAEALARRFHYLAPITLPRGMIDLGADIPDRNVHMVAAGAQLVAREDFHPALVSVLLQAASKVHGGPGIFRRSGEYPVLREGEYPLSEDAQRYFKSGPPFLQRYMPFWVANLIERLIVLILPLIAVLIPVVRIAPAVYDWRIKGRIFRWYRELKAVEIAAHTASGDDQKQALLRKLDEIEDGVAATRVPLTYWDYTYNLRQHIDFVRARVLGHPVEDSGSRLAPP